MPSRIFQQSNFPELAAKVLSRFLEEWLEEVSSKRPLSKLEIMQREMEVATSELYERAAELRDAIKRLKTPTPRFSSRKSAGRLRERFGA